MSLSPLVYGQVVGRYVAIVADTPADPDLEPDVVPMSGRITLTPLPSRLLVATAQPAPVTVVPVSISAMLDDEGYVSLAGNRGVYVIASNDPATNPTAFSYRVTYELTLNGVKVPMPSFDVMVPAGGVVDLTTVAPVPPSGGEGLAAWQVAVQETLASQAAAEAAAVDSVAAAALAKERADEAVDVANAAIVDAQLNGYDLTFIPKEGAPINVGNVRGPAGPAGPNTVPTQTAVETVIAGQKGQASGIVPMATGADWSDAARKLHAQQYSRGASEVNVLVFGADPTGATDSTTAINDAITTAKTFNVGTVFIPAGRYLINGTIAITHEVRLRGQYMAYAPSSGARTSGTVLVAGTNASGAPVIEAKNPTAGGYLAGIGLQDIMVLGSASWTSAVGAKDRVGIHLYKVISEWRLDGVMVTGFLRQGIHLEECYDGTQLNVRVLFCGTDGTYAALHYGGTAQGNTNSVHSFGVHVENCPYLLLIEGDARHNAFVACKFELFTAAPLNSPIYVGNSRETTFVGCYFVSRSADDPIYSDSTVQPHFIRVAYAEAVVTLVDCNLNSAPYTGAPTVDPSSGTAEAFEGGARWVRVTAGRFQAKGGTCRVAWAGAGAAPFILQKGSSYTEATIYTGAKGGTRTLFELNGQARVTGCEIMPQNAAAAPTAGALFNCTGARNIIGPNLLGGAVFAYLASTGGVQQTVIPGGVDTIAYTSGNSVDLGFVSPYATEYFNLQMAAATNVSQFTGGWLNREVTIRFGNANTTLVNSGNLILKGGVNANPPANAFMKFIALTATVWVETGRSF